jgi:hypothetical protein
MGEAMKERRLRQFLAVTGMAAFVSAAAWGSMFEPVSDQRLVCESLDIVRGTIVSTQSAWEGDPQAIWTRAVLEVKRGIRGERQAGDLIDLKEIGGTVGDYTIVAHQFPTFRAGDEVVLMLAPWDDGSPEMRVWGYGRGMFLVSRQHGRPDEALRYDLVESNHSTMHTDRLQPMMDVDDLVRNLRELSARCPMGGAR